MPSEPDDEKRPPNVLTESMRDRLFKQRAIVISGDINQSLAAEVTIQLLALAADSDEPINMFIHSQGGHVESGDTIHDMIRFIRPRVRMIGSGWVASAGALIFVAVPVEDRFCLPNTRFLLHQPSGGMSGPYSVIDIEVQQILLMKERLNKIFARQTGQPLERIEADTKRNFWLEASAAKEYGLVGKIIQKYDEIR
ncbi:ATP-dependent Clp protease proteolytic subunit [Sorangium sp. So ce1000]|uniref:ATP-dependent Clp protease proteolytic subunit n=1 Tax=Sorangium sp. So ce1000 TaxID=3133325 RepID=UPI003F63EC65